MTILHGENQIQSRQKLVELLNQANQRKTTVTRITAKHLTTGKLEEALGETSLFATPKLVVIEELHSLQRSKKKTALIEIVAKYFQNQPNSDQVDSDIILWEKRQLTATMIKKFPTAQVFEFKISKIIFKWLESMSEKKQSHLTSLKLMHQAIEQESAGFAMMMLIRQIRLLIQAKSGGKIAGQPFMISKLKSQATGFSLSKLLAIHADLLELDLKLKTSASYLDLPQQLDLLILKM